MRTYVAKVSGSKQDLCDRFCFNISNPRFLRFLQAAPGPNGSLYLTAVGWAEMKKNVSYKVDVILEGSGVIGEAQCECGAGQGPAAHCKHVCTLVYGTICFIQEEKILTEVTCTKANYGGSMPAMQLVPPANLHGVLVDHDYLEYDAAYQFLVDEKLISINDEDVSFIEFHTRGQNKCREWKKSLLLSCDLKTNSVLHGLKYESVAVHEYEKLCKTKTTECGFFAKTVVVLGTILIFRRKKRNCYLIFIRLK
ncbi:hypothetical protein LOTGIDRAFT_173646 [Lottia gigantea]|uniref:SWIM-type domain-containing protein n=1 Tax=Lottia gigantea TaxID=225164 RepID=V4AQW4_LOTGI|nr:hypothetical protein LOTGIDRAFT_173646 [Lottia gigantea]ESO99637.1 hypothetical protein LOTGIDRAFT_173646 [Lottia gigantea]